MNIALFEDVTTESILSELETKSKDYEGLYVDMDNPPERKYVKDKAAEISGILKRLDRARIDKARDFKVEVEAQAESIRLRLEAANKPFTELIDEYKAKRKKILDAEKAAKEAEELKQQIEDDHEMGLLLNDKYDSESKQREKEKQEREQRIRDEAASNALLQAQEEANKEARDELRAQQARERDVEYKSMINNTALDCFVKAGLDQESAKIAVKAIASNMISNVTINY